MMKHKIYVVGIGPGREDMMTGAALEALEQSDVIVGYHVYLDLLGEKFRKKERISTPMRQEKERCIRCFEETKKGKQVAMILCRSFSCSRKRCDSVRICGNLRDGIFDV